MIKVPTIWDSLPILLTEKFCKGKRRKCLTHVPVVIPAAKSRTRATPGPGIMRSGCDESGESLGYRCWSEGR